MNLVKAHRALAEQQYGFLIAHAPDAERVAQVAGMARSKPAHTAQSHGRFIIEELIDPTPGATQAFESPERGTDIEVPGDPKHRPSRRTRRRRLASVSHAGAPPASFHPVGWFAFRCASDRPRVNRA